MIFFSVYLPLSHSFLLFKIFLFLAFRWWVVSLFLLLLSTSTSFRVMHLLDPVLVPRGWSNRLIPHLSRGLIPRLVTLPDSPLNPSAWHTRLIPLQWPGLIHPIDYPINRRDRSTRVIPRKYCRLTNQLDTSIIPGLILPLKKATVNSSTWSTALDLPVNPPTWPTRLTHNLSDLLNQPAWYHG
jgi:hypothetical protein